MKKLTFSFLALFLIACSQKNPENSSALPRPADMFENNNQHMEYQNYLHAEANEETIIKIHSNIYNQCTTLLKDKCIIVSSNITRGNLTSINIKIRSEKENIKKFISFIESKTKIINHSLMSENLSKDLQKSDKKLKILLNYQSRLETLERNSDKNINSMLKIAKELAENQAEIEELKNDNAINHQKVSMELLEINLSSTNLFINPILNSLSMFKSNLAEGISATITCIAFLFPASIILFIIVFLFRKIRKFLQSKKT